ncbi:Hypothetical predicted protein [Cloeon dipterum]|uniref:Uncharacterized protein n=1 Tax=Cloeon dipterum TaxID=197152 RepID=A0A8S1DWM1_9INSE|nr:Hypothetical predicted protein [Cloeon dipterum]
MHLAASNEAHGLDLIYYFGTRGLAIDARDRTIAETLLERRFPDGEESKNNLLHFCIVENRLDLAKIALAFGEIMLNECGQDGFRAIHLAARFADLDMCKWLIGEGARAEENVLHLAALNHSHGAEIIFYFVSRLGMKVNAVNKEFLSPLHNALSVENIKSADMLVRLGANLRVKIHMENLVHFSIRLNKLKSAKFCHAKDKKLIHKLNQHTLSALHNAAQHASKEMCRWLVEECGVRPKELISYYMGYTVLHCACWNKEHGSEVVDYLVTDLGLDPDSMSQYGWTPLHLALFHNNPAVAEKLVSLDADIRLSFTYHNYLHISVKKNYFSLVKLMHQKCPELVTRCGLYGRNTLHFAARYADVEIVKWLVSQCAFNVHSKSKRTKSNVLHYAAKNKAHGRDIIRFFLSSYEMDVNKKNIFGFTPLHYAAKHADIVEELQNISSNKKDSSCICGKMVFK